MPPTAQHRPVEDLRLAIHDRFDVDVKAYAGGFLGQALSIAIKVQGLTPATQRVSRAGAVHRALDQMLARAGTPGRGVWTVDARYNRYG